MVGLLWVPMEFCDMWNRSSLHPSWLAVGVPRIAWTAWCRRWGLADRNTPQRRFGMPPCHCWWPTPWSHREKNKYTPLVMYVVDYVVYVYIECDMGLFCLLCALIRKKCPSIRDFFVLRTRSWNYPQLPFPLAWTSLQCLVFCLLIRNTSALTSFVSLNTFLERRRAAAGARLNPAH